VAKFKSHLDVTLKHPGKAWVLDSDGRNKDWFVQQVTKHGFEVMSDYDEDGWVGLISPSGLTVFVYQGDYLVLFADGDGEPFSADEFETRFNIK